MMPWGMLGRGALFKSNKFSRIWVTQSENQEPA